jgi:levansucrase
MISAWTSDHLQALSPDFPPRPPPITAADAAPVIPGLDIWDMWPLALADGGTADIAGGTLWFALSAPVQPDPIDRHRLARIRLLHLRGAQWRDCGDALPDGFSPGSREWSGSAILDPDGAKVILFFTAAGRQGEPRPTMEQRLFQTSGILDLSGAHPSIRAWSTPRQSAASDGEVYDPADAPEGAPGTIKAFRDPAYFRDPADGRSYLLFAASLKRSSHAANGAVGLARATGDTRDRWALLPPIIHADGLNNELERPHALYKNEMYYVFWSTQRHTFAANGPKGPNGLYGMVAPALRGPYRPLNGSGLVVANPDSEPTQAYSWWVMGDGQVTSFVDYWGMGGRALIDHPELIRTQFGGTPAPFLALHLDGDRAVLDQTPAAGG